VNIPELPALGVLVVQRTGTHWQHAEQQAGRVPHHPPGLHLLHALRAESLEPGHFGVQVVGMNVQVDARRAGFQALHEQHQVVSAEEGAVIFGGVDLWQFLPERALPECQPALSGLRRAGSDAGRAAPPGGAVASESAGPLRDGAGGCVRVRWRRVRGRGSGGHD
jgi:hypothetical protein